MSSARKRDVAVKMPFVKLIKDERLDSAQGWILKQLAKDSSVSNDACCSTAIFSNRT
jgi:hypothetical protein